MWIPKIYNKSWVSSLKLRVPLSLSCLWTCPNLRFLRTSENEVDNKITTGAHLAGWRSDRADALTRGGLPKKTVNICWFCFQHLWRAPLGICIAYGFDSLNTQKYLRNDPQQSDEIWAPELRIYGWPWRMQWRLHGAQTGFVEVSVSHQKSQFLCVSPIKSYQLRHHASQICQILPNHRAHVSYDVSACIEISVAVRLSALCAASSSDSLATRGKRIPQLAEARAGLMTFHCLWAFKSIQMRFLWIGHWTEIEVATASRVWLAYWMSTIDS